MPLLFFPAGIKLTPTITDNLESKDTTITCSQQAQVERPYWGCVHLFATPDYQYSLKPRSIKMSWMYLKLHQLLNDTKRPKEWPLSLSGDNLMLAQVTYMHELSREYYKSECNEVLNWVRQTVRLLCNSESGSSWAELVRKALGKKMGPVHR